MHLEKKIKNGRITYYLAIKKRVNGKPRRVWQRYLGTAEKINEIFEEYQKRLCVKFRTWEYGKTAALLSAADELKFVDIVNRYTNKKRIDGLTVGEYLLLITLGRCDGPYSKEGTGGWFKGTYLKFLQKPKHKLNSQNFRNHMEYIDKKTISKIENEMGKVLIEKGLSPSKFFWDTTNSFTYITKGEKLPQKGNNKQKRYDKNIVGLGLAVSEENIPFFHVTYPGNEPDAKLFPKVFRELMAMLKSLNIDAKNIVLVLDKGNNSEKTMKKVLKKTKVVGSVKYNQIEGSLDIPIDVFKTLYINEKNHEIKGYQMYGKLFDNEVTVVLTYNKHTHKKQKMTYEKYKESFLRAGNEINEKIKNYKRGRKHTKSGVIRRMEKRIPKQYQSILKYDVLTNEHNEPYEVKYWIDEKAEEKLKKAMGKQFIFTNSGDLSTEEIVKTYNQKYLVEDDFKWINNKILVPRTPYFVRKDNMIIVHDFLCVIGLLFYRYLMWKAKDMNLSKDELLNALKNIRVGVIKDKNEKTNKVQFVVEELTALQAKLFSRLDLSRYLIT